MNSQRFHKKPTAGWGRDAFTQEGFYLHEKTHPACSFCTALLPPQRLNHQTVSWLVVRVLLLNWPVQRILNLKGFLTLPSAGNTKSPHKKSMKKGMNLHPAKPLEAPRDSVKTCPVSLMLSLAGFAEVAGQRCLFSLVTQEEALPQVPSRQENPRPLFHGSGLPDYWLRCASQIQKGHFECLPKKNIKRWSGRVWPIKMGNEKKSPDELLISSYWTPEH